jgi:hypothetical protein
MRTLVQTTRLDEVDCQAWLADAPALVNDHRIADLRIDGMALCAKTGIQSAASAIGRGRGPDRLGSTAIGACRAGAPL